MSGLRFYRLRIFVITMGEGEDRRRRNLSRGCGDAYYVDRNPVPGLVLASRLRPPKHNTAPLRWLYLRYRLLRCSG